MYSNILRFFEQSKSALINALVIIIGLSCSIGYAQEGLATVRIDGNTVFRVGSIADQDARARARQIEQRLSTVLDTQTTRPAVRIGTDEKNAAIKLISVAGRRIVTVTPIDAEENATSSDVLASRWAGSIETALIRAAERRLSWHDRFVAAIQLSIQTGFAQVLKSAILIVPKALAAILVILVFWLIASSVRWLMRIIFRKMFPI